MTNEFLEYDFSLMSLKLVEDQNEELLKEIKTNFAPIHDDYG